MEPKEFLNHTVAMVVGVRETKGDKFGVELELEGRGVGLADVATRGWNRHHEQSLRGESIEFTTAGSRTLDDTKKIVTDLWSKFKDNKVKINENFRTSTHVHLNFSDKPVKYMINFFTLFTLLEEVLQYYSGEDRKGNLFCISSRDAEGIIGVLSNSVRKGSFDAFAGDRYKYGACNLSSLYKFGTVEVRTMRGAITAEQVNDWLDILNDMYVYACTKMQSPFELIRKLSEQGGEGLLRAIFSNKSYENLMSTFPRAVNLHYSLMEGARIIQVFAYGYEDDFLAKVDVKKTIKGEPGAPLPRHIQIGRWAGNWYQVYRLDGLKWDVSPPAEGLNWEHGMSDAGIRAIKWNAQLQRFTQTARFGRDVPLNWSRHHVIADEGPRWGHREVEEELDWDDNVEEDRFENEEA